MQNSTQQSGLPHTDYYAPRFYVEIDGKQLSPQTNGDVLSIKVKMDMDNMNGFDLTIANWDDKLMGLKYSDLSTFSIGRQVHIKMGYADPLVCMITGQITSLAPKFPQQGPTTLTVSGLDGMFRLKGRHPVEGEQTKYTNNTDWQIAEIIAARNNLAAEVTREGETHSEVVQKNQDDAQFLMERAKRIDFECFVLTDPDSCETTLYFIRPTDGRDNGRFRNFSLSWGKNLISFMPTINVSEQVHTVTVQAWDPATKQPIIATADPEVLPKNSGGGSSGPEASQLSQKKNDIVVDSHVTSYQEALELAKSLLLERSYNYITATGQIIGQPDLRPGDNITVDGVGSRFSGPYYIKKVEHSLDNSGYKTQFEARRINEGTTKKEEQ